jgi:hypothetical protein
MRPMTIDLLSGGFALTGEVFASLHPDTKNKGEQTTTVKKALKRALLIPDLLLFNNYTSPEGFDYIIKFLNARNSFGLLF